MASSIYPHMGFLVIVFWALSAMALRAGLVREGKKGLSASVIFAISVALSFIPVSGLNLSGFVLSFIPVFSSGSLFIAAMMLTRLWSGKDPLNNNEWLILLIAGGSYTLVLMVSALGLIPYDLYAAGYGDKWFIGLLALGASALALWGSVLAWWLLATPALWWMEAVPGGNINDTLTDVLFLVLCLVILVNRLLAGKLAGLRKPRGALR